MHYPIVKPYCLTSRMIIQEFCLFHPITSAQSCFSECISKFSGGCVYYYPMFHYVGTPHLAEKFEVDLRRYLTRKIGFESVMRIRCSKG